MSPVEFRSLRRRCQRHQLAAFAGITVAWSWGYWVAIGTLLGPEETNYVVTMPGLWGPLVAASVIVWLDGSGVRRWLADVGTLRIGMRWYLLAIGLLVVIPNVGAVVVLTLTGTAAELTSILSIGLVFTVGLLVGGGPEEVGVRGFAHSRLRQRYGTITTGVLIGVPWAIWHLPLHWLGVGFGGSFAFFVAALIPISIVLGWLFDAAGGSVVVAMVAHAAVNTPNLIRPVGPVSSSVELRLQLGTILVYWLVVGLLVVFSFRRPSTLSRMRST